MGLKQTIHAVRQKIIEQRIPLSHDRDMTRQALVDPLLAEMGWDISDPDITAFRKATAHSRKRMDYVLDGVMAVEVKMLDEPLDMHVDQLMQYGSEFDLKYGALTNGRNWWVYDLRPSTHRLVAKFNIMDTSDLVAKTMKWLRQMSAASTAGDIPLGPTSALVPPVESDDWTPVAMIEYKQGMVPPVYLRCEDETTSLTSWFGMLERVAQWLVDHSHLGEQNCPIWAGPREAIMHTDPLHPDGRPFARNYRRIENRAAASMFYLNPVGPSRALRHTVLLIQAARLEQQRFVVNFLDTASLQYTQ